MAKMRTPILDIKNSQGPPHRRSQEKVCQPEKPTPLTRQVSRRRFLKDWGHLGSGAAFSHLLTNSDLSHPVKIFSADVGALKASIAIDASEVLHAVNPNIYGTFIEHIGRCIYGGVYEAASPLSDEEGFRKDVMTAARDWGAPILRWPGGNFASNYHGTDGIGPKTSRPRKYNAAWFQEESNQFGTNEFIGYCRKVGAEPYICINLGTGTIEEAANWVEYCNGAGNTYFANLRRQNDSPEPFHVRYWGLGNEIYGWWQIGHKNADDYAKVALECAKLMKWVDPSIKLVACGSDDAEWNRIVLEKLVNVIDYISVHDYEGTDDYEELLGSVQRLEQRLKLLDAAIELTDPLRNKDPILKRSLPEVGEKKRIEIACDEWNVWYRKRDIWHRGVPNILEERYNLRDALWTASVLNLFHRMADRVTLANIAQMVNVIAAMFTNEKGMFLQTIYFPMKLYRQESGCATLRCMIDSPKFSSKSYKDLPFLDVSVTLDKAGRKIALVAVNRHRSQAISTDVFIQGAKIEKRATVFEVNGSSPEVENSFEQPANVGIQAGDFLNAGNNVQYAFPAHSITLIKMSMA